MNRIVGLARDGVKELRRVPILANAFAKTDPARRASRILKSGLVDAQFYAAQVGVDDMTDAEAAEHYVRSGHSAGLTVNPFLDDATLREGLGSTGRPAAFDYLWSRSWRTAVSPFWDVERYIDEHPEALQHDSGPVGDVWARVRANPDTVIPVGRGGDVIFTPFREWRMGMMNAYSEWSRMDGLRKRRQLDDEFAGVSSLGSWPDDVERPLVSIVLATWNRSGQLRDAIESVIAQTWEHWELIVVDDGSWDDTHVVASVVTQRDPRVKYLPREHEGVSAARNAGIAVAAGEFVTFIDSDNTWLPHFVEEMMIGLRDSDAVAGFATLESHDANSRRYRQSEVDDEVLALGNLIDLNTLIVRRTVLETTGGFDTSLSRAVDYDLIMAISRAGRIQHVPILGAVYDNAETKEDRISTSEPLGWNTRVRIKHLIDWDGMNDRHLSLGADYVIILHALDPNLIAKCDAAAELADDDDTAVHLYFVTPRPTDWIRGWETMSRHPRLKIHLLAGPAPFSFVIATALGHAAHSTTVVIESSTKFDARSARQLATYARSHSRTLVGPTLVHPDGTVATIGATFPREGAAPVDLFSRHPLEDVVSLGEEIDVPALAARTFAMPTEDLVAVQGINPLLYNEFELPALAIALREHFGAYATKTLSGTIVEHVELPDDFPAVDHEGSLSVIRSLSRSPHAHGAEGLYERAGLRIAHYRSVTGRAQKFLSDTLGESRARPRTVTVRPVHHLQPVVVRDRSTSIVDGVEVPRLRWAIRIASPWGAEGQAWGDTHFARSLAAALRRLGQEVVIDHREVRRRPTDYLDDVTLVLRGLDPIKPETAGTSILWVISHPEDVKRSEVAGYDHVFAASIAWAREATGRWGLPVEPLLQCTDSDLFFPTGHPRTNDVVFVGKSRGVPRTSVVAPVRAGIPVRVFGPEWEGILPDDYVEAEYVANDQLSALYESAGVVLNDHWSDMRRDGFISNRLFDVVAAGGRALSDDVEGVDELFDGAVRTFEDGRDLVEQLRALQTDDPFPDHNALLAISARVREEHSFLARARLLLDTALAERADRSVALS